MAADADRWMMEADEFVFVLARALKRPAVSATGQSPDTRGTQKPKFQRPGMLRKVEELDWKKEGLARPCRLNYCYVSKPSMAGKYGPAFFLDATLVTYNGSVQFAGTSTEWCKHGITPHTTLDAFVAAR